MNAAGVDRSGVAAPIPSKGDLVVLLPSMVAMSIRAWQLDGNNNSCPTLNKHKKTREHAKLLLEQIEFEAPVNSKVKE